MVKSKSRWTALTTALNHSVATVMIHERIFVPLLMISLAVLDQFEQKLYVQKENLTGNESLDTSVPTVIIYSCLRVQRLQKCKILLLLTC